MKPQIRLATGIVALGAAGGLVLGAAGAPAGTPTGTAAQAKKISHAGVGKVRIGMRFAKARNLGLVGPRFDGCPVDASDAAELRAPLKGFVDVSRGTPRRIARITITGGRAQARGVRVGDPLSDVLAAFPKAKVQNIPDFNISVARVSRSAGGRFDFVLRSGGQQRVRSINVRRFAICD